jgi:hypothetical protein
MIIDLSKFVNWKDAPEWANFAVFDGSWNLWWFEHEPSPTVLTGWGTGVANSRSEKANLSNRAWTKTLTRRPT